MKNVNTDLKKRNVKKTETEVHQLMKYFVYTMTLAHS